MTKTQKPEWVVNDSAELGVKIGDSFFWLHKGDKARKTEALTTPR